MIYYEDDPYDPLYEDDMPGGDGILGEMDEGIFESVVIIGLVTALVFLVMYRQQRQQAARRQEEEARRQQQEGQGRDGAAARNPGNQGHQGNQERRDRGFFPPPGDPDIAQWAAGGVGH